MNTPQVNFRVINNSNLSSETTLGINCAICRTTKGSFFDPSVIYRTPAQFRADFGEEIVPDGSLSNVEKALQMGSMLRICKVGHLASGIVDAENGVVTTATLSSGSYIAGSDVGEAGFYLNITQGGQTSRLTFRLLSKEQGGEINSTNGQYVWRLSLSGGVNVIASLHAVNQADNMNQNSLVGQWTVTTIYNGTANNQSIIDTVALQQFATNNKYAELRLDSSAAQNPTGITSFQQAIDYLNNLNKVGVTFSINNNEGDTVLADGTEFIYHVEEGNQGTEPTLDDWKAGVDAALEYSDYYNLIGSHIQLHLPTGYQGFHQYAGDLAFTYDNFQYIIEIDKRMITAEQMNQYKDTIGVNNKNTVYVAGGLKLYNNQGILTDSDGIGTFLGLQAQSSTNYFPWYSVAGPNRGIVPSSSGPVAKNYGGDSSIDELNTLANNGITLYLIKPVKTGGRATMYWHNFTSSLLSNTEKFLNVRYLILYIKKTLRPILESYLEEPNNIPTWSRIYNEITPVMQYVQDNNGVNDWLWEGDQFATNINFITINNIQDVKSGKYRAVLTIDEVVSLQQINIEVTLDTIERNININEL